MIITVTHKLGCRTERRIERDDLCTCGAAPRLTKREERYKGQAAIEEWTIPDLWHKRSDKEPALAQVIVVKLAGIHRVDNPYKIICFGVDDAEFDLWFDLPKEDK